jgi:hypothetical protein
MFVYLREVCVHRLRVRPTRRAMQNSFTICLFWLMEKPF